MVDQHDRDQGEDLWRAPGIDLPYIPQAEKAVSLAVDWAWQNIRRGNHWREEVLMKSTDTSEQVFFYQSLGMSPIPDAEAYRRYLLNDQQQDGSWSNAPHSPGDISFTCEAYLALKILGVSPQSPELAKSRRFILENGGVAKVRVLTRIFFAQFGLIPWDAIPQLPAELIFMSPHTWINIYRLSYWARQIVVPLLIISHHQHVYALPNGTSRDNDFLDEIWIDPKNKMVPFCPFLWELSSTMDLASFFFSTADTIMYYFNGLRNFPFRTQARKKIVAWLLEHQENSGDIGGISIPMRLTVQALLLEGFSMKDQVIKRGIEAMERFMHQDTRGKRMASYVSPVWDTVLMTRAICDAGYGKRDHQLEKVAAWIKSRQILNCRGDWNHYRPHVQPAGFCFQYQNSWYPDLDDTSAAVLALLHQNPENVRSDTVVKAVTWMCGLQNRDHGWGAFEPDNDSLWLNKIPFSDPSTPDITGHVLEALGEFLKLSDLKDMPKSSLLQKVHSASSLALEYLARSQESFGGWYGRWGVNYIYGASAALCGLSYFSENNPLVQDMAKAGVKWLKAVQNQDGGWGEGLESYRDKSMAGKGESTPSQTAWGVMSLLEFCTPDDPCIVAGIRYLLQKQTETKAGISGASWEEDRYTGTGFPKYIYMGYPLYRNYFPLMALGRYISMMKLSIVEP